MKKINYFIISTDEFGCIEIFDNCMLSGIQMTLEEAEMILIKLAEEIESIKVK